MNENQTMKPSHIKINFSKITHIHTLILNLELDFIRRNLNFLQLQNINPKENLVRLILNPIIPTNIHVLQFYMRIFIPDINKIFMLLLFNFSLQFQLLFFLCFLNSQFSLFCDEIKIINIWSVHIFSSHAYLIIPFLWSLRKKRHKIFLVDYLGKSSQKEEEPWATEGLSQPWR